MNILLQITYLFKQAQACPTKNKLLLSDVSGSSETINPDTKTTIVPTNLQLLNGELHNSDFPFKKLLRNSLIASKTWNAGDHLRDARPKSLCSHYSLLEDLKVGGISTK